MVLFRLGVCLVRLCVSWCAHRFYDATETLVRDQVRAERQCGDGVIRVEELRQRPAAQVTDLIAVERQASQLAVAVFVLSK